MTQTLQERLRAAAYRSIEDSVALRRGYGITQTNDDREAATDILDEAADRIDALERALLDATAHLAGAASAYRQYACRHVSKGNPCADPFYSTRVQDFDKATSRARAALTPSERKD